ncbi:PREDICTED: disintegrin and metalloproteinase domain-containing protein 10-like [Gavialis gangeticus]|uniref:disintegrin and metalloproteinase domain-containing protein 10-like n=1 Tax=Gavialis gangeticus TaxID=94835 RepID=UPI00092F3307|nr:PREDICTED: disintegrin and metalloproteinase domain-containing protein 10-like [Gavialis gangeticus]
MLTFWGFCLAVHSVIVVIVVPVVTSLVNRPEHLRPFVKYYERVFYDTEALEQLHQKSKRAAEEHETLIQLEFQAYQRTFKLRLSRDTSAFTKDFEIQVKDSLKPGDVSFIYSGGLHGKS